MPEAPTPRPDDPIPVDTLRAAEAPRARRKPDSLAHLFGRKRYRVNALGFVCAFICAPIAVTILSFWTFVGLFAPIMGGIPYVLLGGPILYWATSRCYPGFFAYGLLGTVSNVPSTAVVMVWTRLNEPQDMVITFIFFGILGSIFSFLWAGAYALIYRSFEVEPELILKDQSAP